LQEGSAVIGLIAGAQNEKAAFLPSVKDVTDETLELLDSCDLLLMDGTFWTDDELIRIQGGGRTAHEMGHIPVSGAGEAVFQCSVAKIFIQSTQTRGCCTENAAPAPETGI